MVGVDPIRLRGEPRHAHSLLSAESTRVPSRRPDSSVGATLTDRAAVPRGGVDGRVPASCASTRGVRGRRISPAGRRSASTEIETGLAGWALDYAMLAEVSATGDGQAKRPSRRGGRDQFGRRRQEPLVSSGGASDRDGRSAPHTQLSNADLPARDAVASPRRIFGADLVDVAYEPWRAVRSTALRLGPSVRAPAVLAERVNRSSWPPISTSGARRRVIPGAWTRHRCGRRSTASSGATACRRPRASPVGCGSRTWSAIRRSNGSPAGRRAPTSIAAARNRAAVTVTVARSPACRLPPARPW